MQSAIAHSDEGEDHGHFNRDGQDTKQRSNRPVRKIGKCKLGKQYQNSRVFFLLLGIPLHSYNGRASSKRSREDENVVIPERSGSQGKR